MRRLGRRGGGRFAGRLAQPPIEQLGPAAVVAADAVAGGRLARPLPPGPAGSPRHRPRTLRQCPDSASPPAAVLGRQETSVALLRTRSASSAALSSEACPAGERRNSPGGSGRKRPLPQAGRRGTGASPAGGQLDGVGAVGLRSIEATSTRTEHHGEAGAAAVPLGNALLDLAAEGRLIALLMRSRRSDSRCSSAGRPAVAAVTVAGGSGWIVA